MPTFKNLKEMQEYINKQLNNAKFTDLFSDKFIQRHTKFKTASDFFSNGGFSCSQVIKNTQSQKLNEYIKSNTTFKSWNDFKNEAILEYAHSKNIPLMRN